MCVGFIINLFLQVANSFAEAIISEVQRHLDHVVTNTRYEVGRCGPLSNVINATLVSTCDEIVLPAVSNFYTLHLYYV